MVVLLIKGRWLLTRRGAYLCVVTYNLSESLFDCALMEDYVLVVEWLSSKYTYPFNCLFGNDCGAEDSFGPTPTPCRCHKR
jgi:hypothetical protein